MADFNASFKLQLEGDQEIKRKFEDLEQTLQDVKKAAEDTSKPLEDTAKGMDDLGKSAGDVDKNLDGTAKKLDDVSKSAGDIKKDLDDVDNSFGDISKSAVTLSSDLKDADSGFSDIASNADGAVSSMDAVKSSFAGISESAVEADQNIAAATTGLEGVGTATESAAAGADSLATSLDNIAASAQEAETNISAAANGIDGIGTSVGQASTALDGLGSAFDGAGTQTTTFNDVLSSTGTQAQAASGGLTPLNTVLGQVGGATQQAQGGIQGFNSNLAIMTGFMGTAASGALQFATSLSNLHGAQIKLEAAQTKLSGANEAVAKAQAKLNELYSSGSASAQEIAQATLDLEQAQSKAAIANERVGKAQDDLNIKYAKFATDTLPNLIQTVTSTIAVLGTMKTAIAGISFAGIAASVTTVLLPALAAAYAGFGVLESVPALTRSIHAAVEKDTQGMVQNLTEFLSVLERFASILPGLGGTPLKLMKEALQEYAKSQGVATEATDGSIASLLNAEEHSKNLKEAYEILTGQTDQLGKTTQEAVPPTKEQAAAIEGIKGAIEGARAGIEGYVAGIETQVEASNSLTVQLHEQNEGITENIQQTMALVGSSENYSNALLTVGQSIADHQVKIDQLNATLNTAEGQQLSYTNAIVAGEEKFLTWVQTTQDAAVEAATFKGKLDEMANTFGGLPAHMEGTVEEYQAFIRANKEGGDAAKEFERISLESWRSLTSAAKPLFDDLKSAWGDIFSGESAKKATDAIADANAKIKENFEQQQTDIGAVNDKMWENITSNAEGGGDKVVDVMEGVKTTTVGLFDGVDFQAISDSMVSPFAEAFNKLPPAVAASLDQTEREALTFQAALAQTAEEAGQAWATNLQANMSQGTDVALAAANQAAIDIIAPFLEQHPEMAQMVQPLIDALQKGTPQGVQEALTSLAGMPGPFQEQAQGMLDTWTGMTGQLGPKLKTGVEGGLSDLTQIMAEGMEKIVTKLDTLINTGIKQKPENIPQITANVNPANAQIQLIGKALTDMKTFLEKEENKISIHATETNPLNAQIQLIGTSLTQVQTLLATPLTITISTDAAKTALDGLTTQIDAMAGKNVTITVDTGPAGIAITGLQGQIDAVHGANVQITVNTGPAGIAITGLQSQIDGVHGTNVFITVDTGSAGTAIREIQGQIDNVHGTNVYITVDTSGAQAAITQLQTQINSLQQSMAGVGTGFTPGYQSPYGSYQGAYGAPYARGFGPAVISKPTRMLVGEAGPELVSVIPMKGKNQWQQGGPVSKTAAAGMGWYGPAGGGAGYGAVPRTYNLQQLSAILARDQGQMQQGAQQGTEQGMQQSQGGMEQAVQQGAQQGVQDGMQQGGGGYQQGGYALTAQNAIGFGSNPVRYGWSGGAMGTAITPGGLGGGGGGAQYPSASRPMGVNETIGFGSRPIKYTWGGGASGMTLTPHGPHVGEGLPGPDPHAPGGSLSQPGGGVPEGYRGGGSSGGGMMPIPPNFWSGTSGTLSRGVEQGTQKGTQTGLSRSMGGIEGSVYQGAREGVGEGMAASGGGAALTMGQAGYPKAYTGEVPASYGKPLGQLINGIAATILPGQGPRGPPMQAALGMHRNLRKDTLIQAHRNERVDISPGSNAGELRKAGGLDNNEAIAKITNLLERLLIQGSTFKVDFNVDGRKLSSIASKNMGTTGYGDK